MKIHADDQYPNEEETNECKICKQKFRLKMTLTQHMKGCKYY